MTTPVFNLNKSLQVVLYVAHSLQRRDFHKIFKIIYFADREHFSKYGRPITGDTYVRMKYGPVPSAIYSFIKRNEYPAFFDVNGYAIEPKVDAEMSHISGSDLRELNDSIKRYGALDMNVLTELSHGFAWNSAAKNGYMCVEDILKEADCDKEYIDYVCEHIALQKSLL
jgi:uncharacterized phage-associated protein